jgi:hypothetical protein
MLCIRMIDINRARNPQANCPPQSTTSAGTATRPANASYQLTEVAGNLKGALPQSPTLSINPEDWYFVK